MESRAHNPPDTRLHYLDNIRSLIIVFVVLFHAILPYSQACPWWYVVDSESIPQAIFFLLFFEPILMPVLFFVSGLLVWPSYQRKGPTRFMASKVRRLLVPFLLCTFLFSPIMPFIRQCIRSANNGVDSPGFWAFWLTFLKSGFELHVCPVRLSPDLVVNQYWFLMLLFLFFAGFCLYNLVRGGAAGTRRDRGEGHPPSRVVLLTSLAAFALVTGLIYALASTLINGTVWVTLGSLLQVQPAKVPTYLAFFLAGIYVERRKWLPGIVGIGRPAVWFGVGVLMTAAYLTAVLMTFPPAEPSAALVFAVRMLRLFFGIAVTLWSLTFFHRHLNRSTTLWRELSSNSYNVYLIHMVPQVVLQLVARSWPVAAPIKFAGVSLLTLLVSYLVSRFLVIKSTAATIAGMVLLFIALCLVFR